MLQAFIKHATCTIRPNQSKFCLNVVGRLNGYISYKCISYKLSRCYSSMSSILKREEILCHNGNTSRNHNNPNDDSMFELYFKLTSYNILAQFYLDNNSYLYDHCHPDVLKWPYRWDNLLKEISTLNSDIYCLQEVQRDHYKADILPAMESLGYHGLYQDKSNLKPDGCAIFFRESMFQLIDYNGIMYYRPDTPALSFYNVGQVALLRPRNAPENSNGGAICIGNTHLFFNPNRGDVKTAQLCLFLSEIDALAHRENIDNHHPIIICGDLNLEPFSPLYNFIVNGRMNFVDNPICELSGQNDTSFPNYARNMDRLTAQSMPPSCLNISRSCVKYDRQQQRSNDSTIGHNDDNYVAHNLRLTSCLNYRSPVSKRLVTSYTSIDSCAVDHIFYSCGRDDNNSSVIEIVKYLALVEPHSLYDVNGIPNAHLSSDHIPIVVHFVYREPLTLSSSDSIP